MRKNNPADHLGSLNAVEKWEESLVTRTFFSHSKFQFFIAM